MKARHCIYLLMMISAVLACGKDPTPPVDGGNDNDKPSEGGLPVPPDEVNATNVFIVDFFSTLEDDGDFFGKHDVDAASRHIKGQSGKRPLVYMFDRADFTVGTSYPLNKMSYDIGIFQFFAQNKTTGTSVIEGTGIATLYPISKYDGIALESAFMSGCTIPAPLAKATPIIFYTSRIGTKAQMEEIQEAKSNALLGDAVIIGTVKNSVKSEVTGFVEDNMSLRAFTYGSDKTALDLLVVVPASYVCRGVESGNSDGLPYYRISIEKWM